MDSILSKKYLRVGGEGRYVKESAYLGEGGGRTCWRGKLGRRKSLYHTWLYEDFHHSLIQPHSQLHSRNFPTAHQHIKLKQVDTISKNKQQAKRKPLPRSKITIMMMMLMMLLLMMMMMMMAMAVRHGTFSHRLKSKRAPSFLRSLAFVHSPALQVCKCCERCTVCHLPVICQCNSLLAPLPFKSSKYFTKLCNVLFVPQTSWTNAIIYFIQAHGRQAAWIFAALCVCCPSREHCAARKPRIAGDEICLDALIRLWFGPRDFNCSHDLWFVSWWFWGP